MPILPCRNELRKCYGSPFAACRELVHSAPVGGRSYPRRNGHLGLLMSCGLLRYGRLSRSEHAETVTFREFRGGCREGYPRRNGHRICAETVTDLRRNGHPLAFIGPGQAPCLANPLYIPL